MHQQCPRMQILYSTQTLSDYLLKKVVMFVACHVGLWPAVYIHCN